MKARINRTGRPLIATLALLLSALTLATAPSALGVLALAKYVAAGTGGAGARFAKWDPGVDLTPAGNASPAVVWGGKTVFMASDKEVWRVVNNDTIRPLTTTRHKSYPDNADGGFNNLTFLIKPLNSASEAMAQFQYEFKYAGGSAITGAYKWLHVDVDSTGGGQDYASDDTAHRLYQLNSDTSRTRVEPGADGVWTGNTGQAAPMHIFLNRGVRPSGYPDNCYVKVKFVWSAVQVD